MLLYVLYARITCPTSAPPACNTISVNVQTAYLAPVIDVTCPDANPDASPRVQVDARVPAVFSAPASLAGLPSAAWISSITAVPSAALVGSVRPGMRIFTVTVDCGAPVGFSNVSCALDSAAGGAITVSHHCPQLHWTPTCGCG